jgi:hypothetical protein
VTEELTEMYAAAGKELTPYQIACLDVPQDHVRQQTGWGYPFPAFSV